MGKKSISLSHQNDTSYKKFELTSNFAEREEEVEENYDDTSSNIYSNDEGEDCMNNSPSFLCGLRCRRHSSLLGREEAN